ncbi:hypothetical protein Taro_002171 [Colocasia esculenta]|uniref:CCHC-type domain-containing protein n=1 Tax=Colocasia esculenta TaxID=4460 RepID=A0A843TKT8_COLES|nr:hypothetical protein [Colocasia esculenta]
MQQTIQELTRALLQDAGAGGNCGAGDLHRNFRNLNPPRFSGTIDPDEAENWLKEIECIFCIMQCVDGDKLLLATFQLERGSRAWWESVEATRADAQFTWDEFNEHFNSKYFFKRVQERKASEFAALKQRHLTVAEYEAQFSRLACYANHLVSTEKIKARRFINGLKPSYITQLAPLDIQVYADMVKKAQLLEDATDLANRIKGRIVKKEKTPSSPSQPTNGKKRLFSITEGQNQERKPKIPTPPNTNKTNCEHCDKPGHTAAECWRKAGACLRCGNRNHRIFKCPVLKEQEKEKQRGSETRDCLVYARKALRTPRRPRPRQESSTNDSTPLSNLIFPSTPESTLSAANSSMLIAPNAPSKAHEDGGPKKWRQPLNGTSPQVPSTGRKVRSDDTDLDGTTQVPGQSPELTVRFTKNLGHPTGEVSTVVKSCFNDPMELTGFVPYLNTRLNLPKSPGSHRTLRELPRQLHHATAFPRAIRQCHTSHDPPTTLMYLLEALGTRGREAGARGRENQVEKLLSGDPITCRIHRLASTPLPPRETATLNVHILCRQVHAVNGTLPGCQQDTATKVSPSVTERREVTCRVPYQKVLRAKPVLGHTPTHNRAHGKHSRQQWYCRDSQGRRDTIVMGKGTTTALVVTGQGVAIATLSRPENVPRQQSCRDREARRDRLIATANGVAIRSRPMGPTPALMSRCAEPS